MNAKNLFYLIFIVALIFTVAVMSGCENNDDDDDSSSDDDDTDDEFIILSIQPATGPTEGGTDVLILGRGFEQGANIYFGDNLGTDTLFTSSTELSTTTPAGENGYVTVKVENPDGEYAELENGFLYGESGVDIGWCGLTYPESTTTTPGSPTEFIFGQVYVEGCTETPGAACPSITAELGWGPTGSDPSVDPGTFSWEQAEYNTEFAPLPESGQENNDEFMAFITESEAGDYNYAYRMSGDGGATWTYCDLGVGSEDGFQTDQMGDLTVAPVTIGWCNLQFPDETTAAPGNDTEYIFGQVYVEGCTEDAAHCQGITAQVGWGDPGVDPSSNPGQYSWNNATYNEATVIGNNDEYLSQINESVEGDYSYAYRFSADAGDTWMYCDLNGSDDGLSTDELGLLHVTSVTIDIDWCNLQFPAQTSTAPDVATEFIFGQIYVAGCTDGGLRCSGIIGEVGWGGSGIDPSANPGQFQWSTAAYNGAHVSDDNDEYMVQIIESVEDDYKYAYRFSSNGGQSWSYCDLDGLDNGFDTSQMGDLIVVDSSLEIGWCSLHWPSSTTTEPGTATEDIYGRVFVESCSEGANRCDGIIGQLGWGDPAVDPSMFSGQFNWVNTNYNPGHTSNDNDEYSAAIIESQEGSFGYAYRFSSDGGQNWSYCDLDGMDNGFAVGQMGDLTVSSTQ